MCFPISATGTVEISESFDLSKSYTLEIEGFGKKTVIPMEIFDSKYFADNYHYDGDDLGATINGASTTFKVWAPTASKVVLNLFISINSVAMIMNSHAMSISSFSIVWIYSIY